MGRMIIATLCGLVAGAMAVSMIQGWSQQIYPLPEGVGIHDSEAIQAYIDGLPFMGLLHVALAYGVGALVAGFIGGLISTMKRRIVGLIVGFVILLLCIASFSNISHPVWVWIVTCSSIVPLSLIGVVLSEKVRPN